MPGFSGDHCIVRTWSILTTDFNPVADYCTIYIHSVKKNIFTGLYTTHDSVACRTSFEFSMWLCQSLCCRWTLLQFIEVFGHLFMCSSLKVMPRCFQFQVESRLWLDHCNTLIFLSLFQSLCCCAWDYCPVAWFNFSKGLGVRKMSSHLTSEYFGIWRSLTSRCAGPVAGKQDQIITSPPPCSIAGTRCFWWYVLVFTKHGAAHYTKTPLWSQPFLERRGFLLAALPNIFLIVHHER